MRLFGFLLLPVLLFSFLACEPAVVFDGPQPVGLSAEKGFRPIYRGHYFCDSDSTEVWVRANCLYKEKQMPFTALLEEVLRNDDLALINGELCIIPLNRCLPVRIAGDSVSGQVIIRDTLFAVGPDQVLKSFRGHQILNKRLDKNKWEVLILSLDEDLNLSFASVVLPNDLDQLKAITPVENISEGDEVQYRVAPNLSEFHQLLESGILFQEYNMFYRIKGNVDI